MTFFVKKKYSQIGLTISPQRVARISQKVHCSTQKNSRYVPKGDDRSRVSFSHNDILPDRHSCGSKTTDHQCFTEMRRVHKIIPAVRSASYGNSDCLGMSISQSYNLLSHRTFQILGQCIHARMLVLAGLQVLRITNKSMPLHTVLTNYCL